MRREGQTSIDSTLKPYVPIWYKATLSIDEAVAYSGIGRDKLRDMTRFGEWQVVRIVRSFCGLETVGW